MAQFFVWRLLSFCQSPSYQRPEILGTSWDWWAYHLLSRYHGNCIIWSNGKKKSDQLFLLIDILSIEHSVYWVAQAYNSLLCFWLFMFGTFPSHICGYSISNGSQAFRWVKAIGLIVGVGEIVGGVIISIFRRSIGGYMGINNALLVYPRSLPTLAFLISFSLIEPKEHN